MSPDTLLKASQAGTIDLGDKLTAFQCNTLAEARIPRYDGQLASGIGLDDERTEASHLARKDQSVVKKRTRGSDGRFVRLRNSMGKYPFTVLANQILEQTAPWYSESTQRERVRKFRRVHAILQELRTKGRISTTSPKNMNEADVVQFIGWCKEHLDNATSCKYLRFLGEVLQVAGNGAYANVKLERRHCLPRPTPKAIKTLTPDQKDRLLGGSWSLEDPFLDATVKAALHLYLYTGMRSSEVRLARLSDMDLEKQEIVVSSPKGKQRWASGDEAAPLMPGAEPMLLGYLQSRAVYLVQKGFDPNQTEPLFPYINKHGKVEYWNQQLWNKLKRYVEQASWVRFKWKDLRPTFGQYVKDIGAPIEIVSKALRHSCTRTTELWYARVRPESAFSQMRQLWEAAAANPKSAD